MNNADEIIPRVWLGNRFAALNKQWLTDNNITVVFNATKDIPFSDCQIIKNKYRIPVDDNLAEVEIANMAKWSPEIGFKILREYKAGKNILIHCAAGMQRSAAAMAIFLISLTGQSPAIIMSHIRKKRNIAFVPQANFRKSIEYFHNYYQANILPNV
jgi:rhodanese-related sulfurtransferase